MAFEPRPLFRLGSASPRRKLIFQLVRIPFLTAPADVEELVAGADPIRIATHNARLKARASARSADGAPPLFTLGADTIVVLGKRVLGKPGHQDEAREMLQDLAGRTHRVITAWCLLRGEEMACAEHSVTRVTFRELAQERIEDYVRDREWTDKAGGYAIQGRGAHLIEHMDGDAFNVMGLPVGDVIEAFLAHAVIPRYPL